MPVKSTRTTKLKLSKKERTKTQQGQHSNSKPWRRRKRQRKRKQKTNLKWRSVNNQVYCQYQLMSKPTKRSVFFCFRIKMERVSVFFFLLSFFCLFLYVSSFFFLTFVIFSSTLRKISVSLSLSLYILSNKHGFS